MGFDTSAAATGRPGYHPGLLLKLYIYGYLNRVQSSRRLEREAGRNVELMWLTGRLCPDFKTIADFCRDNGKGIRNVCRRFVALCRQLDLFSEATVAIDGSKFKAVNNRDKNFTPHKLEQRMKQIDESIERYLQELDTADRTQSPDAGRRGQHIQEKLGNPSSATAACVPVFIAVFTQPRPEAEFDRGFQAPPKAIAQQLSGGSERMWSSAPAGIHVGGRFCC